ncbi:MAG: EMC3/TMCO1 family protein [Nanoarchaeota archaeon]
MNKEGSFKGIFIVMIISLLIAFLWNNSSFIKNTAHSVLDPSVGLLLNWNITWGMAIIVLIISVATTLIQKYATDQKTLREMKKEQKSLQEEMKKYREHPEKMMELQKKQMEFIPKMLKISMRPVIYTAIPLILFFRWFMDFFTAAGDPKFFGFLSWFWFYLILSLIFSSILRKLLKVV